MTLVGSGAASAATKEAASPSASLAIATAAKRARPTYFAAFMPRRDSPTATGGSRARTAASANRRDRARGLPRVATGTRVTGAAATTGDDQPGGEILGAAGTDVGSATTAASSHVPEPLTFSAAVEAAQVRETVGKRAFPSATLAADENVEHLPWGARDVGGRNRATATLKAFFHPPGCPHRNHVDAGDPGGNREGVGTDFGEGHGDRAVRARLGCGELGTRANDQQDEDSPGQTHRVSIERSQGGRRHSSCGTPLWIKARNSRPARSTSSPPKIGMLSEPFQIPWPLWPRRV